MPGRKVKGKVGKVEVEKAVREKALTKKEVRIFNNVLLEKLRQSRSTAERVIPKTQASDLADMAQMETEVSHKLQQCKIARREIVMVQQALRRMEEGEYGICEDCGEQIPRNRLNCQPAAACCIDCTKTREKMAKRFRAGRLSPTYSKI